MSSRVSHDTSRRLIPGLMARTSLKDRGGRNLCHRPAGKQRDHPFHGVPLPLSHHRLVDAVLHCQLRRRQFTELGLHRHTRLEFRRIPRPPAVYGVRPLLSV